MQATPAQLAAVARFSRDLLRNRFGTAKKFSYQG